MTPTDLSDNKDVIDADPEEKAGYHGVDVSVAKALGQIKWLLVDKWVEESELWLQLTTVWVTE